MLAKIKSFKKINLIIKHNQKIILKDFRSIEILTNNFTIKFRENHDSIGINLDTNLIFKILSKEFVNIKLTKIDSQFDLKQLVKRKPKLVFSGIKYFNFNNKKIWLNDFLDLHGINYINSKRSSYDNVNDKFFCQNYYAKK